MLPGASSPSSARFRLGLAALALVTALVLFAGNAGTSVLDRDEARFALAVREMRLNGEWVLPTNYGAPRYHKPILAYWLALGAERLFGPGEFAWRFPSGACGIVTVLTTAALARDLFGERVGLRAGIVLATSLLFVFETKILTSDAGLLATTTLTIWAWTRLADETRRAWLWRTLFWLGVGLGVLAKAVNWAFLLAIAAALALLRAPPTRRQGIALGLALVVGAAGSSLPGLGFLGPTVFGGVVALVLLRELHSTAGRRAWSSFAPAFGIPLALLVAASWVVPAIVRSRGGFLVEGVGHHLFGRTVDSFEGHRAPSGYYLLTIAITFLPWVAFLPAALRHAWRERRSTFFLAWVLGPWVMVELMTSKLQHYLLVAFPALAVLVALEWERRASGAAQPGGWLGRAETVLLAVPSLAFAAAGAALLRLAAPGLRPIALALLGLGVAFPVLLLVCRRFAPRRLFAVAACGATALYLVALGLAVPALEPLRLSPLVGAEVARVAHADEPVHLLGYHPASVGCYLPAANPVVEDQREIAHAIAIGRSGLFVVPNDPDDPRFDRIREHEPDAWEHLATVRGLPFPKLETRELWIVRRGPREP